MLRRTSTLILYFAALSPIELTAQQPFPSSADLPRWSVEWFILGQPNGTVVLQSPSTTSLCGHTYNTVSGTDTGNEVLFRNEGQRTWLRNSTDCGEREYLLYDFTLNVGDSTYVGWQMEGPTLDTTLAIVQSIDVVAYEGVLRRRFSVIIDRCPDTFGPSLFTEDVWIEGVGSMGHPFYSTICLCDFCETGLSLLCADSGGVATYRRTPQVECDWTVGIPDTGVNEHTLTVNYAAGQLGIDLPGGSVPGTLVLYDTKGSTVQTMPITADTRIPVGALPAGIYTVEIRTPEEHWSTRFTVTD